MLPLSQSDDRSLGALLHDLVEGSSRLLRQEWKLASLQLREIAGHLGSGIATMAAAGVCLALGSLTMLAGLVLAVAGGWIRSHVSLTLASGIVLVLLVVYGLVRRGISSLVKADFADENVQETIKWQQQPRKFAAISR